MTDAPPTRSGLVTATGWLGQVIDGRYRVDAVLGEGGMGAVFAAEHLKLGRRVALKVILPHLAGDAELAQRFAREAMASGRIDHPHVASALDYGALPDGGAYLVMQLARGDGLRALIERAPGVALACEVGAQVADALAAAHAQSIVHRDLKPENVIVETRDDGALHARVLDFGIAHVAATEAGGAPLTRVGTVMGTPGYMAPEQALGDSVDARADVYSLGALVWEMAAGRALFPDRELSAVLGAQLRGTAPRLATALPNAPPELDALVARMLELPREKRPSASEAREVLRRLAATVPRPARGLPALATSDAAATHVTPPPDAQATAVTPPPDAQATAFTPASGPAAHAPTERLAPTPRPSTPSLPLPWLLGGAAVLVLLLLLGGGALALGALFFGGDSTGAVAPTAPTPTTPAAPPGIPPPPEAGWSPADIDVVASADDPSARAAAATRLAAHLDELPDWAHLVVALELAASCDDRKTVVRALSELRDPRAVPALQRLRDARRAGCGTREWDDCNACLRHDLDHALHHLHAGHD